MRKLFERTLLLRLGLLMALITVLAITGMAVSVVVAEMLNGDAAAINQAGSLRMQSYLVLDRALTAEGLDAQSHRERVVAAQRDFVVRLQSPRLTGALPDDPAHPLRAAYEEVAAAWLNRCEPLLDDYLKRLERFTAPGVGGYGVRFVDDATRQAAWEARDRAQASVDAFVAGIDAFVGRLEANTEDKIRTLRAIQGVSLFLTLGVVFVTMYFMQTDVLAPLADLLHCARSARGGDFSQRVQHTGQDELGSLGEAFNVLSEDLSKLYVDLERRVATRTEELQRSNRSLELLYRTLERLNEDQVSAQTYRAVLGDLQEAAGFPAGAICIADLDRQGAHMEATTFRDPGERPPTCSAPLCAQCVGTRETHLRVVGGEDGQRRARLLTVPLGDQQSTIGVLNLEVPEDKAVEGWQVQLAEAVGRHVGLAHANARRRTEGRRMALLEERAAMARELHDSLAQSLSYLKIQVTRLQSLIDRSGSVDSAASVVHELREGLSSAYRQLRELLTTFRIQFDGRGLAMALSETLDELRARTATELTLDFQLGRCQLDPNEEIHVLQIVREALTNIVNHARARRAVVSVRCADSGGVRVSVRDDGVGLRPQPARVHHYGMTIMHERASTLGGELRVQAPPGGGTDVVLTFVPQSLRGAGAAVERPLPVATAATQAAAADAPPPGLRVAEEAPGRA